ncbi:hypothetical protein [Gimesia maris]|uniref:hypothetical protein n=1 Tax=Gimesia maris TaxID=122 RepID=UPI003A936D21
MKYLIAACTAGFLILAMFGFIWKTEGEFRQFARDRGWDGEQDVGMEMPGDLLQRVSIANLLRVYSIPFSILLAGLCFGIAFWIGCTGGTDESNQPVVSEEQT